MLQGMSAPQRLDATFLQLYASHRLWRRDGEWKQLFDDLAGLQVREVIVQWTALHRVPQLAHGVVDFHRADGGGFEESVLETLLHHARRCQMQLVLGLVHDHDFWDDAVRLGEAQRATYLQDLGARTRTHFDTLLPLIQPYAAQVSGWYLPLEVALANWPDPPLRAHLGAFVGAVAQHLRSVDPHRPVAISGFVNGEGTAGFDAGDDTYDVAALWLGILNAAPALSTLLLQDGVGPGKQTVQSWATTLQTLHELLHEALPRLEVIVETFENCGTDASPDFQPTTPDRLRAQVAASAPWAQRLVAFQMPGYMCEPSDRDTAKRQALRAGYLNDHPSPIP
jgi:hypothetical protein